ncbi:RNase H family protein [Micavibrio aeruginosavorus]|uniref:RNase H family protein n=1 Tax=Micavibrio aeruginosavorus TaxID=349221 RepID=UPI003F4AF61A
MKPIIQIWCDGSYRQAHKTSGAGWVIHHDDGRVEETTLTLPSLRNSFNYGSQIAELSAAMNAMNALPAGSCAVVHMDCQIALDSLQAGRLLLNARKPSPSLQATFKRALKARDRLGHVTFALASDSTDPRMKIAHQLSRDASAYHPS